MSTATAKTLPLRRRRPGRQTPPAPAAPTDVEDIRRLDHYTRDVLPEWELISGVLGLSLVMFPDEAAKELAAGESPTVELRMPDSVSDSIELSLDDAENILFACIGLVRRAKGLGWGEQTPAARGA